MSDETDLPRDAPPGTPPRAGRAKAKSGAQKRREKAEREGRAPGRPARATSFEAPLKLYIGLAAAPWAGVEARRDPEFHPNCGEVLLDSTPSIAKALDAMIRSDPRMMAWAERALTGGGPSMLGLMMAMQPFVTTVIRHHVLRPRRPAPEPEPHYEGEIPLDTDLGGAAPTDLPVVTDAG